MNRLSRAVSVGIVLASLAWAQATFAAAANGAEGTDPPGAANGRPLTRQYVELVRLESRWIYEQHRPRHHPDVSRDEVHFE